MNLPAFKQAAHQLIDALPETAGWNELIYQAVMRREIEAGLEDSRAGRVVAAEDLLAEYGLADDR